jgi:hypothetical protein
VYGVAKGIDRAFGGKTEPTFLQPKEYFDQAPRFDVTVEEDADDGR